jgi:hypothetical protein
VNNRPVFPDILLGKFLSRLKVSPETGHDDVIDEDRILVRVGEKRVISGADILGRLLHGIVQRTVCVRNDPPLGSGA